MTSWKTLWSALVLFVIQCTSIASNLRIHSLTCPLTLSSSLGLKLTQKEWSLPRKSSVKTLMSVTISAWTMRLNYSVRRPEFVCRTYPNRPRLTLIRASWVKLTRSKWLSNSLPTTSLRRMCGLRRLPEPTQKLTLTYMLEITRQGYDVEIPLQVTRRSQKVYFTSIYSIFIHTDRILFLFAPHICSQIRNSYIISHSLYLIFGISPWGSEVCGVWGSGVWGLGCIAIASRYAYP